MTQKRAFSQLRDQAIALRLSGKSRREIKAILSIGSNETLNNALRGVPPPTWMFRPRAKGDLDEKPLGMRSRGCTYDETAAELGVSKGSVARLERDLPRRDRLSYEECRRRNAEGVASYWEAERPIREARRQAIRDSARADIGALTDREILIAGAVAYWCEGSKSKGDPSRDRVVFINSDPQLILFYLRFLAVAGITPDRLICRVHIHQSADVMAAQRYWQAVTGVQPDQFRRPTLKHHEPKTVRKETGDGYHGCLVISVRQSAELYRRIEGWAYAAMAVRTGESPADR
jgi:hypothetical protein